MKVTCILIHVRKRCKITIIDLYYKSISFKINSHSSLVISQISFSCSFKFNSFTHSMISMRKHTSYRHFLSLIIEYLASIPFVSRKSWIGVKNALAQRAWSKEHWQRIQGHIIHHLLFFQLHKLETIHSI